jgi:hypothetical protein
VRGSRTGIALLVAAGLAGCGSGTHHQQGLSDRQARALVAQLEAMRSGASGRNVAATTAAVAKFRRSVVRLRRAGAISDGTARSLRIGAARVLERVQTDSAPPPQPTAPAATQTTPAPAPPPAPPPGKKKHEEKKEHGKGKGHGHGEEGD